MIKLYDNKGNEKQIAEKAETIECIAFDVYSEFGISGDILEGIKAIYNRIPISTDKPIYIRMFVGSQYAVFGYKVSEYYASFLVWSYALPTPKLVNKNKELWSMA